MKYEVEEVYQSGVGRETLSIRNTRGCRLNSGAAKSDDRYETTKQRVNREARFFLFCESDKSVILLNY